ncbi:hypothetical protein DM01DRAFT_1128043 [Hesseltinella vesiculosa]|uniref:Uncharacterized protein n=1 Tax=Hesseltinella vesiculosa TaxID=101127 RepID=A0A1X2GUP1_9FUNG|nr:hypothetical protein DM01DRAFT_1128043 [Hesseltinella vesiculosa]
MLGVGLCVCLRKANTLVPNRYSFPLVSRHRPPHLDDLGDEETRHGLLQDYDDDDSDHGSHENSRWDTGIQFTDDDDDGHEASHGDSTTDHHAHTHGQTIGRQ